MRAAQNNRDTVCSVSDAIFSARLTSNEGALHYLWEALYGINRQVRVASFHARKGLSRPKTLYFLSSIMRDLTYSRCVQNELAELWRMILLIQKCAVIDCLNSATLQFLKLNGR